MEEYCRRWSRLRPSVEMVSFALGIARFKTNETRYKKEDYLKLASPLTIPHRGVTVVVDV